MKRLALAVACLWACAAHAAAVPWDASYNPTTRTTTMSVSSVGPGQDWAFQRTMNGMIQGTATGRIPGPLGSATVTATGSVARSVAVRALAIAAKAIPVIALGGALWEAYQQFGAQVGSDGQPAIWQPQGTFVYTWTNGSGVQYGSMSTVLNAIKQYWQAGWGADRQFESCYVIPGQTNTTVAINCKFRNRVLVDNTPSGPVYGYSNEIYEMGAGNVTAQTLTQSIEKPFDLAVAAAANDQPDVAPALQQVAQVAPVAVEMPAVEPQAMPAPQASPWQATVADPTKQERAVYTPRWSAKDQAIVWDKVNEVKNAAGEVTSTPEAAPSSGAAGGEGIDICKEHPEILACQELGEAEEGDDLNRKDKNVDGITPWGSFGPSNGSCPNYSAQFMGQTIAIDLQLVCDGLSWMRPAVIGLAWIMAAYIFIGGIKQGD